jgi:hypothetical protein
MRIDGVTWSNSVPPVKKPPRGPAPWPRPSTTSFAPSSTPSADVALDAVARLLRDDRAHLGVELHAVLDLQRACARSASSGTMRSATSPTSTATLMAMQRSPAEP